jgi:hypothetical protein
MEIAKSICESRGSSFASAAQAKISELVKKGAIRSELIQEIAYKSGVGIDTIYDILAGHFKEVPEQFNQGFSKALDCDLSTVDMKNKKNEKSATESEIGQEKKSDEDKTKNPFREFVVERLKTLIKEGTEHDEAIANAITQGRKEGKCAEDYVVTKEDYEKFFKAASDNDSKGLTEEENNNKVPEGGNPINTASQDMTGTSLDQSKQTNVLLGTVVSEIQGMRSDFRSLVESLTTRIVDDNETSNEPENVSTMSKDDVPDEGDDKSTTTEDQSEDENEDYEKKSAKQYSQKIKKINEYLKGIEKSLAENGFVS